MKKDRKKTDRIIIFTVIALFLFSSFTVEAELEILGHWQLIDNNTLTPVNESYNVGVGKNDTTVYKLYVNGTARFFGKTWFDGDLSNGCDNITARAFYGDGGNLTNLDLALGELSDVDIAGIATDNFLSYNLFGVWEDFDLFGNANIWTDNNTFTDVLFVSGDATIVNLTVSGHLNVTGGSIQTDWDYYKVITIESDYIDANLINFPVLVNVTDTAMIAKCQSSGEDIRFFSIDNVTEFAYEIEEWTEDGFSIWVNISEVVTSGSDYTFLMYYGNAVVSDGQDADATWHSDYRVVLHLNDDTCIDSSGTGNDGVNDGTDDITGRVGRARDFVLANTDSIVISADTSFNLQDEITFSFWSSVDDWTPTATMDLFRKNDMISVNIQTDDDFRFYTYDTSVTSLDYDTSLEVGVWYYWTVVWSDSGNSKVIYLNGTSVQSASGITGDPDGSLSDLNLGMHYDGKFWLDGWIDEFRLIHNNVNASYAKADFHTQNQTTGFMTFGSEQSGSYFAETTTGGSIWIGYVPDGYDMSLYTGNIAINGTTGLMGTRLLDSSWYWR